MSEAIYSQEQMLKVRNENYAAGVADSTRRILRDVTNQSTEIADAYKFGDVEKAFALLVSVIQGEPREPEGKL